MAIIDYDNGDGIGISKDTNVCGDNVYIENGQGCGTIWFKNVKEATEFLKKYGMISGLDSGLCKECSCHYSIADKNHKKYPKFACRHWKEGIKNNKVDLPMPGDAVEMINYDSDMIADKSIGIIEGSIGEYKKDNYDIIFNLSPPRAYNDNKTVSGSGGPVLFVNPKHLVYRGKKTVRFWKFIDNYQMANNSEEYKKQVNLWQLDYSKLKKEA